jgi:hypothetical protein
MMCLLPRCMRCSKKAAFSTTWVINCMSQFLTSSCRSPWMRRMKFNSILLYITNMFELGTCTTEKWTTRFQVMNHIPQGFKLQNQSTIFCFLCKLSMILSVNFREIFYKMKWEENINILNVQWTNINITKHEDKSFLVQLTHKSRVSNSFMQRSN